MTINRLKIVCFWLYLLVVAFSVSLSFALGDDNRNLMLIVLMGFSPLIIIRYLWVDKNDILLLLFILMITFAPMINHPESMRWSTVLYSIMFCITFMAYSRLLHNSNTTILTYSTVLKWLIYAYTIVLLIQQFCVLAGLPIFNLGNYDTLTPWKLNSLTTEPAHSARVVSLLMYCYLYIQKHVVGCNYTFNKSLSSEFLLWFAYSWTMITMGSASAILFFGIVITVFLNKKSFVPVLIAILAFAVLVNTLSLRSFERVSKVAKATLSMDEQAVMNADGSAAARIVPTIKLLKEVTVFSVDGLFGHGIDKTRKDRVVNMERIGYGRRGVEGGALTVWYDYGFLVFLLWIILSMRICINYYEPIGTTLFWLLFIFIFGVNNQFVWLTMILLYTNKKIAS